jgi:hypothetical protein
MRATAHYSYAAWRENIHDDLVLSVAMACGLAEKVQVEVPIVAPHFEDMRRTSLWNPGGSADEVEDEGARLAPSWRR